MPAYNLRNASRSAALGVMVGGSVAVALAACWAFCARAGAACVVGVAVAAMVGVLCGADVLRAVVVGLAAAPDPAPLTCMVWPASVSRAAADGGNTVPAKTRAPMARCKQAPRRGRGA